MIGRACDALSYVICSPEMAALAVGMGLAPRLFALMGEEAEFRLKVCAMGAISSLMGWATVEIAAGLIELGFFECFHEFVPGMCQVIPHQILGAVAQIAYLSETNGCEEWRQRLADDVEVVDALDELVKSTVVRWDDHRFGLAVANEAQGAVERLYA
jgi:hypothetical protein